MTVAERLERRERRRKLMRALTRLQSRNRIARMRCVGHDTFATQYKLIAWYAEGERQIRAALRDNMIKADHGKVEHETK